MVRFVICVISAVFSVACASEGEEFTYSMAPLPGEAAVLELLNDPNTTHDFLDEEVNLERRAASRLVEHRNGVDGVYGTDDDNLYGSLTEVEAQPYVGPVSLDRLRAYAVANGFGG